MPFGVEFHQRGDAKQYEDDEDDSFGSEERRLGLRRRQRLQHRYFGEGLGDEDEDIEIKRDDGAAGVDPARRAAQSECVSASSVGNSTTSETMPKMRAGVSVVPGNKNPVTLVSTVVRRNRAVQPGSRCEPNMPNTTISPQTIPIRLMMTWSKVKVCSDNPNIMARSRINAATMLRRS
jgi:hypothetical protein